MEDRVLVVEVFDGGRMLKDQESAVLKISGSYSPCLCRHSSWVRRSRIGVLITSNDIASEGRRLKAYIQASIRPRQIYRGSPISPAQPITTLNYLIQSMQHEMPQSLEPTVWYNNTYLIASLCALRLFAPIRSYTVARILSLNFSYRGIEAAEVRYFWGTIIAEHPPWFEHITALRRQPPGPRRSRHTPGKGAGGTRAGGWRGMGRVDGVGRSMDYHAGENGGAW